MYKIYYLGQCIGKSWFPLHIGDKYKGLTVVHVDYGFKFVEVS